MTRYFYTDDVTSEYVGETLCGIPHGYGELIHSNGCYYKGVRVKNLRASVFITRVETVGNACRSVSSVKFHSRSDLLRRLMKRFYMSGSGIEIHRLLLSCI
jgi:hypothetical protein